MNTFQVAYKINKVFFFFLSVSSLQTEGNVLFILESIQDFNLSGGAEWNFFYIFVNAFFSFICSCSEFDNISEKMILSVIFNILIFWNQLCLDLEIFNFCENFISFSNGEILYVELVNKYGSGCLDFIFLNSFSGLDWCGSICTACCKLQTCEEVREVINVLFSIWHFSQEKINFFKQIHELCVILNYPQIHEEFIINLCKSIIKKNRDLK